MQILSRYLEFLSNFSSVKPLLGFQSLETLPVFIEMSVDCGIMCASCSPLHVLAEYLQVQGMPKFLFQPLAVNVDGANPSFFLVSV